MTMRAPCRASEPYAVESTMKIERATSRRVPSAESEPDYESAIVRSEP